MGVIFRIGVIVMRSNRKISVILRIFQSFFTSWALMKAGRMEPGNIFTLIFFLLCFIFYGYVDNRLEESGPGVSRKTPLVCIIIAVIFSTLYLAVDYPLYIETLTNPLFRIGIISAVSFGFVVLFYHLLKLLFALAGDKPRLSSMLFSDRYDCPPQLVYINYRHPWFAKVMGSFYAFYLKHTGSCAFLLCMFCWLPYFLYQYPGIMTPDSINQFEQVLGVIPYSNHHPWMHTLLIKLFYDLGFAVTGSMLVALSCYTFFQMCMLAFSVSYFINTLKQYYIRPLICLSATLFYALVPYHAVFSVTIWKDILFAAAVLCFGCTLLRTFKKASRADLFLMGISGLMLCLFRSNGWYAFLLCFPVLLLYFRKKKKTMYPVFFTVFLLSVLIKWPLMNALHVTQPDLVESLSIPIQQVAAVLCNDRELADDELELIENVADLTYIKDLYVPYFADNMKELVRAGHPEYLEEHKQEFLKLWAALGIRYPGDYLTAYIRQTYGYWYPDSFYLVAEAEGVSATSLGVSHTPLIRGPLVVKFKEISIKLGGMIPLYGTLWSMGVICWVLIFSIGCAFVREELPKLILYLPSAALLLTVLIATPVATEFRYVYFMVFSFPFYLTASLLILPRKEDTAGKI